MLNPNDKFYFYVVQSRRLTVAAHDSNFSALYWATIVTHSYVKLYVNFHVQINGEINF